MSVVVALFLGLSVSAEEIIKEIVNEYTYPVCYNFPSGHIIDNYPLIFGSEVELMVDNKCSLKFL